jgi:hypothetical protein
MNGVELVGVGPEVFRPQEPPPREVLVNRISAAIFALAALAAMPFSAAGQGPSSVAPVTPAKSGMVSYIQGAVFLNDERLPDPLIAQYPYMKEDGTLRTAEGRAEVFMNPGLSVHLDANTSLRMISNQFEDTRVELTGGSAVASTPEIDKLNAFTIKIGDASIAIAKSGTYHFYAEPARVKVFSGVAKVQMGGRAIEVPAGKMLDLAGETATLEKFDKSDTDALDRWAARRGELMAAANLSSARNCTTSSFISSTGGNPCSGKWRWNPWYNLYTYIPYANQYCDPFWGYCYYNPMAVMMIYQQPRYYGTYGGGRTVSQPTSPAVNRPGAVTRTINSSNRPSASPGTMSNSRGVAVSQGVRGGDSMGGGIGSSGTGGGSMGGGGAVSTGGGSIGGGAGAAPRGGGVVAAPAGGGAVSTGGGVRR